MLKRRRFIAQVLSFIMVYNSVAVSWAAEVPVTNTVVRTQVATASDAVEDYQTATDSDAELDYNDPEMDLELIDDVSFKLNTATESNANGIVDISDPELKQALINEGWDTDDDGELSEDEMRSQTVLTLYGSYMNIKTLDGLEYATELEMLEITSSQIEDISAISNLTKLTEINFSYNQIADISAIANLKNLGSIDFRYNQLSDISVIQNLANLWGFYFGNNQLTDIPNLKKLENIHLYYDYYDSNPTNPWRMFDGNMIPRENFFNADGSIKFIEMPGEDWFEINAYDATVVEIPDTGLKRVLLEQGWDSDNDGELSRTEMRGQTYLDYNGGDIVDLTGLEEATELTNLNLQDNHISNIDAVTQLTKLYNLNLCNNDLTDIPDLSNLKNLQMYGNYYDGNGGYHTEPFKMFGGNKIPRENFYNADGSSKFATEPGEDWYEVNAYDATVVEIPDAELKKVLIEQGWDKDNDGELSKSEMKAHTWLSYNYDGGNITDLTGLEEATELTSIYLPNHHISNIDVIAQLTKLYSLDLRNNDLTVIPDLSSLENLNLYSNYSDGNGDQYTEPARMFSGNRISRENFYNTDGSSKFATEPGEDWYEVNAYDATVVEIPDAELKKTLITLGWDRDNDGELSKSEMQAQTWLSYGGGNITELTGLEAATELTGISLPANHISNIDTIAHLTKVYSLNLSNNDLTDIPDLSSLKNLNLYNNYSDGNGSYYTAPAQMFDGNRIVRENFYNADGSSKFATEPGEDWYEVNAYDATVVDIPDAELKRILIAQGWDKDNDGELSKSEMKTHTYLSIGSLSVQDLTGLEYAVDLYHLMINASQVENIDVVQNMTKLSYLDVTSGKLMNIPDLSELTNLQLYNYSHDQYGNITGKTVRAMFTGCQIPKRNFYNADGSSKFAVEPEEDWYALNAYDDTKVDIPDAELKKALVESGWDSNGDGELDVSEMKNQTSISVNGRSITDLTGLETAVNLGSMSFTNCQLTNIPDFKGLTKLRLYYTSYINGEQREVPNRMFVGNKILRENFTGKFAVEPREDWLVLNSYDGRIVDIVDATLKQALIDKGYDRDQDGELQVSEMYQIESLTLRNLPIESLSGMEYAVNLWSFRCEGTNVSDLTPISGLFGEQSYSYGCNIRLMNNQIEDVTPLAQIKSVIYSLQLDGNKITDITPLKDLKVCDMTVNRNQLTDIPDFSSSDFLNRQPAMFAGNRISREAFDGKLPWKVSEEWLITNSYDNTKIVTFGDEKLEEALIQLGYDTDGDGKISVSEARSATKLDLSSKGLSDLTGLEECINLTSLDLKKNNISDLEPIKILLNNSPNIMLWGTLNLSKNQITDISPLGEVKTDNEYAFFENLTLNLSDNQIVDISPIGKWDGFYSLDISDNNISDISVFEGAYLNLFYARNNKLTSVPKDLEFLFYIENNVTGEVGDLIDVFSGNQLTTRELTHKLPYVDNDWLKINACDFGQDTGIMCKNISVGAYSQQGYNGITTKSNITMSLYAMNGKVSTSEISLVKGEKDYSDLLEEDDEKQTDTYWKKVLSWSCPPEDGTYTLTLSVTAEDGSTDDISTDIIVDSIPKITMCNMYTSSDDENAMYVGDQVNFRVRARGIVDAYSFTIYLDGTEIEEIFNPFDNYDYYCRYQYYPEIPGNYTVKVTVYGSDGASDFVEKIFNVQAGELTIQDFASSPDDRATVGDVVDMKAAAFGGIGELQYQFIYKKDGILGMIRSFKPNYRCTWTPTEAGEYTLYVIVMDEAGNKKQITKEFTVESGFTINNFTISSDSPQPAGTTLILNTEVAGGQGTLQYQYIYKKDGVLGMIRSFNGLSECTWTPALAGEYTVYAIVKDEAGNKIQVTKDYVIEQRFDITNFQTSKESPQTTGTAIKLQAEVAGGEGTIQYQYFYKKDGVLSMLQAYKAQAEYTWTPAESGEYILYALVKDEAGSKVQVTKEFTVEQGFEITSFTTSLASPQKTDTQITLKAESAGGEGTLKYQFFYKKDGILTMIRAFKETAECTWTPKEVGTYTLYAVVQDSTEKKTQVTKDFVVEQGFAITDFTTSKTSPQPAGSSITLKAEVTGGEGTLQYQYFYKKDGILTMIRAFKESAECTWTPKEAGDYILYAVVKDSTEAKVQVTKDFTVEQGFEITEFKTSLNSPQSTGTSITLKAETAGGAGALQYQYFYKKDGILTMIQAFKTNAECVWTPSAEGSYILYAVVKDEAGNKVQVTKEFEIEQGFGISSFNTSVTSPQSAGTSITLSADVTGGEGTLQYQYLYKKNGTLTMIQAFKAQREVVWKPAEAGNYILYVVVKDAGGNKKQVTKEYIIQ